MINDHMVISVLQCHVLIYFSQNKALVCFRFRGGCRTVKWYQAKWALSWRAFPIGDYAGQSWPRYWNFFCLFVCLFVFGIMIRNHRKMSLQIRIWRPIVAFKFVANTFQTHHLNFHWQFLWRILVEGHGNTSIVKVLWSLQSRLLAASKQSCRIDRISPAVI